MNVWSFESKGKGFEILIHDKKTKEKFILENKIFNKLCWN